MSYNAAEPEDSREEAKDSGDEHEEQLDHEEETEETDFTEDFSYTAYYDERQHQRIVEHTVEEDEDTETHELEGTLSVKSDDGSRVKKFVVSYETKMLKTPSPVPSHGKSPFFRSIVGVSVIPTPR